MVHELGLGGERIGHGLSSRLGHGRADVDHQWMDPLVVAAPWLIAAAVAYRFRKRA